MANYTVKKGDTLAAIAKKYGTTYQDIAEANGISNPSLIYPGQTLTIGGNEKPTPASTPAATTPEQPAAPEQTAAPAQTPTQTVTPWTYDPFTVSESTAAADQKRQELSSQKPGDFSYGEYEKSDVVKQAEALLQQQLANKPGEYQSAWQTQLDETLNKILNREKFTYDLNGDALYQQYKDQYVTQGQMAMMDTMGQAVAMTGGYGNSYAQSVGQQAYQGHLQQLNDKIPELYQIALNKYQMEGDDLYNQYSLLSTQDQMDYGKHRDTVSDWQVEMDRLQNQYNAERDYDYSKWADNRDFGYGQFIDDRNYDYQIGRDKVTDEQWQKEFDEAVRQFNFANKLGEFAVATPAVSYGGGGGGGGDDGGGSNYNPKPKEQPQGDNTSFTQKLANLETVGATGAERAQVVDAMVKDGTIAPSQAVGLKHIWAKD